MAKCCTPITLLILQDIITATEAEPETDNTLIQVTGDDITLVDGDSIELTNP